jgi:pimeloyl-ACP methyl ester carboxylesterase
VLEERACEVGGIDVRYRVAGTGPPTVLVHGLAGSWRWWEPVITQLATSLRVYLVDLPGFGSARGQTFVLGDAPSYVRSLLAQIGLERANLVGYSLGGAVCARVAALWPQTVDRLVLAAPAGLLERRHPAHYALPLAAALRHARPAFLRVVLADSLRAGVLTLYHAATQLLGEDALRDELHSISAPTLLIWGDRDPLVPLRLAQEYERAIPHAQLVVFDGVGHIAMAERPNDFSQVILDFLDERREAEPTMGFGTRPS